MESMMIVLPRSLFNRKLKKISPLLLPSGLLCSDDELVKREFVDLNLKLEIGKSVYTCFQLEKQVKKIYRALAVAPVPVGIITHYMRPVNVAPRLVSEDCIGGWHLCQLEVLECKEVPWPADEVMKTYKIEDCGWSSKEKAYECKINLLTGKTHQIRAQFAAIGAPIMGDSMYIPSVMAKMANPSFNPQRWMEHTSEDDKMAAIENWIAQHGKEPNAAIGLQASHISWHDGKCSYKAGNPWWRSTH